MKKQIISTLLVAGALSAASAQTATTTTGLPPVPPTAPLMLTGDATLDAQIRALNKEMETKIRAIREDYQARVKAIIATKKAAVASSTNRVRGDKERRDDRGSFFGSTTSERPDEQGDNGQDGRGRGVENRKERTPENIPQGNAWGFFQRFFGLAGFGGSNNR